MATIVEAAITPEDLLSMGDRAACDLIDGELVEREMGQTADSIAATLLFFLASFVRERRLGLLNGAQGGYQIFPGKPNQVRFPDVSFTRADRLPGGRPADGHARVAPDLVVEVVSPHDLAEYVEGKIADFLEAGVALVWVVYPRAKSVQVYRADGTGQRLGLADTIDGEGVLPGFQCRVAGLFE